MAVYSRILLALDFTTRHMQRSWRTGVSFASKQLIGAKSTGARHMDKDELALVVNVHCCVRGAC